MTGASQEEASAYMTRRRHADPEFAARQRSIVKARQRALVRLGKMHPDDLAVLLNEERRREGLPPAYESPTGRPSTRQPCSEWLGSSNDPRWCRLPQGHDGGHAAA